MFDHSNDQQPQTELDMDLPPIVPVWPSPGTITELLLQVLLRDGSTDIDAFTIETGSHEIRKWASNLRDLMWIVDTYSKPAPTKLMPGRKIGHYTLNLKKIDLLKVVRP